MPSALEFMEKDALILAQKFTENYDLNVDSEAYLLIEVDGFYEEELMPQCEKILCVLEANNCGEVLFAILIQKRKAVVPEKKSR